MRYALPGKKSLQSRLVGAVLTEGIATLAHLEQIIIEICQAGKICCIPDLYDLYDLYDLALVAGWNWHNLHDL